MASFPSALIEFDEWVDKDPSQGIEGTDLDKTHLDPVTNEITAIETTLGINPQSTFSTVGERLTDMDEWAAMWALAGGA